MSENIKLQPGTQARAASYDSPEDMFQPPTISSLDQIEDALTCVLNRCEAQVTLLFMAVESGNLAEHVHLNSLWLLQAQLEQMHSMIRARTTPPVVQVRAIA